MARNTSSKDRSSGTGGIPTNTIGIQYRSNSSHGPPWRKIAAAMSTLTNHANNNNNNNINNNNSSGNSASIQQQHQYQFSPQGATPATSTSTSVVGSSVAATSNSFNNNFHASDCINVINNNLNSATSQSQPTAPTTSTTASNSSSSGGVVSGILGVQEFSAKLFLPFSRSKMMHSSSTNATANTSIDPSAIDTMEGGSLASAGPSKGTAGNMFTSATTGSSGASRGSTLVIPEALNVVLHGYQRKQKTNKKKYFVVYGDRPGLPARLEYFDSEKKFKQSFLKSGNCEGPTPKRSIALRSCFNINKRHETKKHVIALYTKDDCFCILFENEDELNRWLRTLLRLQRGEESEGDPPKPTFEHVWDVYVQRKGLGDSYGILGNYRLCITDKILSLVRIGSELTPHQEKRADVVEFSLASIRRCGHSQRYFYLEVGRSSKTGAGEIWMEVQDSIIAQNMYTTIMKSAKSKDDNLGPMIRIRSSSANAASKPTSMLFRRQTHTGQKPMNCSPSSEDQLNNATNSESSSSATSINTVVLVGSPPKGSGTNNSSAPNSKPRSVVVANPNLPACAENSLLGSCAISSSKNATATSATSTINATSTSIITPITCVTTATSSTVAASMANSAMYTTTPDSYHVPTIVPFAGHRPSNSSTAAVCSTFASTPAAMFTCSHSSTSSLTSIGSCSPSDAYVPLIPGAGRSTSPNQHPLSAVAAGGVGGSGATVSGRGGLIGSPRLGVTTQSPNYRRMSLKKSTPESCAGRTAKMEAVTSSPLLSSNQRGGQQSRHYHQQQQHLHGAAMLPPSASHLSHHHTLLQYPYSHLHNHPYLHHGAQTPLTSSVVATGAVGHLATPNTVAGLHHTATGVIGTSSCSSSRSSSSSSNSTSTIAITNEFSSSSTDHVSAISTVNTSTATAMATSMTAAMMMLPPSPSASMSKFHHYASTRQGGREVPGSGGSITLSNLLATITNSIVGSGGSGGGNGVSGSGSGEGGPGGGGSGSSSGSSFSNFSSSKSSSCCSSTVSIQTVTNPAMGPPAPPPPPPLPPPPPASALRGVRRHTRSLSHQSANAIYLTSAKPLRRLRSTLRRHSVSVTSATSTAGVFHQRALSLPSAPMLGHSPHSNMNHLGALHATGSSVRSSSQSSVAAAGSGQGPGPTGSTSGQQHIVSLSASLSSTSASSSGTIQPIHHRTRSLPLTEESTIRVTNERSLGQSGWWQVQQQPQHHNHHHHNHFPFSQQQHYSSSYSFAAGAPSHHRKASSAYLLAPTLNSSGGHACSLHGTPNSGGGWSPPVSDVLCTSPHRHQYECSPDAGSTPFASLVPSRSSMESIIEDQRYLPMDLKKPSSGGQNDDAPCPESGQAGQLPLISRLLRSSNLLSSASPSSPSPSTSSLSAGKMGLLGLKMAMMADGGRMMGGGSAGSSSNSCTANGGCSCNSPSSQCSSSSNCNHAISSNTTSHKSTNGSSPAALRRPNGGRTASGTITRSVAIARDRCDSLPSRNRTTSETMPHQQQQQQQLQQQHQNQQHHQLMLNSGGMPPPRMIPSNNRPHSVHISHSNSPPVNSSPLSPPPPATYSTGSDGSSLSIDESMDSFITGSLTPDEGNGYPKVINQLNSGCSIPEENSEEFIKDYGHIDLRAGCGLSQHDDFAVPTHHTTTSSSSSRHGHYHHNSLSLPISQATRRGGSPAPPSTVGSVEGSAYMEMCSPSGSSPGDPSGSCYMAMSPVADFSRGLCSSSSAHSRASSLAEDMVDGAGYVPMSISRTVPPTEEYVLMDPTLNGGASSRLSNATSGGGTGNNGAGGIGGGGMSSAASSCSITSGTPSTDLRLSLEKVPAYIGQSDDHEVNDRPFRTYSVGSRPELIKRKLRVEMLSSGESSVGGSGGSASSRQRAFSVGSRAKVPRCSDVYKGYSAAPVIVSFASTSSQGSMLESSNNNSSSSTSSISHAGSFGASIGENLPLDELATGAIGRKSGSGSLYADGSGKPPSHGSHGRMSDLMEIDYSSPRQLKPSTRISEPAGMEDYLDMSGNVNNNEDDRRPIGPQASASGYVEMRPGRVNSQSEENDYLNMTPGAIATTSRIGVDEPDCPGVGGTSTNSTSSPIQISSSREAVASADTTTSGSSAGRNNNYLEMYPRAQVKETNRSSATATKVPSEDYLNMAPLMISSLGEASGSEEKMNMPQRGTEDESLESSSAPDGYMEMSWNHGVVSTGPSSSSSNRADRNVPINGEDYMNMSFGPQSDDASRTYSAPITIQPSAGKCRLDLSGESKVEAGTNIPNYLPLGQHPDTRKSVHHPHIAPATIVALQQHLPLSAQQAPIQTTTGQQSGSIGFSPSKPAETPERSRCDSRDSGIVTPSGSQPTIFPFSPASPTKPFAPATNHVQDETKMETLEDLSQNYAELSLGRQQQQHQVETPSPASRKLSTGSRGSGSFSKLHIMPSASFGQPDYVNYCPSTPPPIDGMNVQLNVQPSSRNRFEDDGAGDYALMNPATSRKLSTPSMGAGTSGVHTSPLATTTLATGSSPSSADSVSPPVLVTRKSTLLLSSPQMGFKPITSSQDAELLLHSKLPIASANSPKALNLARRTGEPVFSFTEQHQQLPPLQRSISTGTRPNSVNSELIGKVGTITSGPTGGANPASAGVSTRPNSANSERLPVISATSSSASSTSTLCESKNQSPTASSTALATMGTSSTTTSPSVPGSRPDSVSSITDPNIVSRPPSVSSERELHYASLDLPPCSKQPPVASPYAPGTLMLLAGSASGSNSSSTSSTCGVTKMDVDEPLPGSNESRSSIDMINSSSPSPSSSGCNLHQQQQQQSVRCAAFTYAKIDFVRSQAQKQHQPPAGPGSAGGNGSGGTSTPQSSQA